MVVNIFLVIYDVVIGEALESHAEGLLLLIVLLLELSDFVHDLLRYLVDALLHVLHHSLVLLYALCVLLKLRGVLLLQALLDVGLEGLELLLIA